MGSASPLAAARLPRPAQPPVTKLQSYECGAEPTGDAWVQFPVGFYLVAALLMMLAVRRLREDWVEDSNG